MNIAFGTVIYKEGYDYVKDFVKSINNQTYEDFDILILNDNLNDNELDFVISNLKNEVRVLNNKNKQKPHELRIELIKWSKRKKYDLLILGDFDDTFSEDRISS